MDKSDPLVAFWHWLSAKEEAFPKDSANPIMLQKLEETIRALIRAIRIQKLDPQTKPAPSAAASSDKVADYENCLAFLNYCQTTLQSNSNEAAYSLALRYFAEKEQATVWLEENINEVFSHYLKQNKEDALKLYADHKDYFTKHAPDIKNIISKECVARELERFRDLLRLEKNLLGIIPLSIQLFAEPHQLAALLLLLLERGIPAVKLIKSHVLHAFLAYHFASPEGKIKQLYKLLGWYQADELITQAQATITSIANYPVAYSLTGEQQEGSPPAPKALESSIAFTIDEQNIWNLYALFGDAFLTPALQFFHTNKNNALGDLLRQIFDELPLKQSAQFINNTATFSPALLDTLAELLNDPLVLKLIDARFGAVFYLARYKPEVFTRINDIGALKAYIEDLLKSDTAVNERLNQLTNLLQTFRDNQGNKEAQAVLYTSILDITLDNSSLLDSSIIDFLTVDAGNYKELIRQRAQHFSDALAQLIKDSSLFTKASKYTFIDVKDCWQVNEKKFAFLRAIDDELDSSFPSDIYTLYAFIVYMAVKKEGQKLNLALLLQSFIPAVIEPSNEGISTHERALIELLATIDDDSVREQCINLLEATPRKQGQWLNTEYGGESVVSRAADAGNVHAISRLLEIGSIGQPIVSEALLTAAKAGQYGIVKFLCNMTTDNKPDSEAVGEAIKHAAANGQLDSIQFLCGMTTDNKPDSKAVGEALNQAAANGQLDSIQFLCGMTTDNRAVNVALQLAAAYGQLDSVKHFCIMATNNKPDSKTTGFALWQAAQYGQLDVVKFFCAMSTDNKPTSKAFGSALWLAAKYKQLHIVKFICDLTGDNKPDSMIIGRVLEKSAKLGLIDVVKYLCELENENKPDATRVSSALKFAVNSGQLEILKLLCLREPCYENKPSIDAVKKALDDAKRDLKNASIELEDKQNIAKMINILQLVRRIYPLYEKINALKVYQSKSPGTEEQKVREDLAEKLTALTYKYTQEIVKDNDTCSQDEMQRIKKDFSEAVKYGHDTMGNHKTPWKHILLNIAVATTGIGIFADIGKLAITGTLFFGDTKRQEKLQDIKAASIPVL